jgi:hypothetical protein
MRKLHVKRTLFQDTHSLDTFEGKKEVVYVETVCETKTFSRHTRQSFELSLFEGKKGRAHEVNT